MTVGETTNLMAIDTQKFMDVVLYPYFTPCYLSLSDPLPEHDLGFPTGNHPMYVLPLGYLGKQRRINDKRQEER